MASGDDSLPVGYLLSGYRIERVLGRGGFGVTYLARDVNLDLLVAIKEYFPRDYSSRSNTMNIRSSGGAEEKDIFESGRRRFLQEGQTMARFRHPNIVAIKQFFEAKGTAYLVMDYCDGRSLDEIIRSEGLLSQLRLEVIWNLLLSGLDKVHAAGFLHRDIKPANIFIQTDWSPILLDFGSAIKTAGQLNRVVTTLVADGYSPIEPYDERGVQGPYTDIYGLAATLYRAVTGIRPQISTVRVFNDSVEAATKLGAGRYSQNLLAAIDAGMAVRPEHRPQNVAQWRAMMGGPPKKSVPQKSKPSATTKSLSSPSARNDPPFFERPPEARNPIPEVQLTLSASAGPPELEELWNKWRKSLGLGLGVTLLLMAIFALFIFRATSDSPNTAAVAIPKATEVSPVPDSSKPPDQLAVLKDCAECPEMQLVRGGTFIMGSDAFDSAEKPSHRVQVPDFYISKWVITRKEWNFYLATLKNSGLQQQDVSDTASEMLPATGITWLDARGYAAWLASFGGNYRLVSEAEWEYAARAGSSTVYFFGSDPSMLGDYDWFSGNSGQSIHPVGLKKPNPFGLYDLYGNVQQWVRDCWHDDYAGAPTEAEAWIFPGCVTRVVRGGFIGYGQSEMRSSSREPMDAKTSSTFVGFRVARSL